MSVNNINKILNNNLLTDNEMFRTFKEVCLIFINKDNKVLAGNENGMIDLPRFAFDEENFDINKKVQEFFGTDFTFTFNEFIDITNYRYKFPFKKGLLLNQKAEVKYYKIEVNSENTNSKYKFLSIPNIKHILGLPDHKSWHECIRDELNIILDILEKEYDFKPSIEDYRDHLLRSFSFDQDDLDKIKAREEKLKKKNPYLDYDCIIDSTLYFLNSFYDFVKEIGDNGSYVFRAQKLYPIKAFSNKLWYSDVLILLDTGKEECIVSLYLLKSIFKNKLNLYLKDDILEVKCDDKMLGTVEQFPKFIIEDKEGFVGKVNKLIKK